MLRGGAHYPALHFNEPWVRAAHGRAMCPKPASCTDVLHGMPILLSEGGGCYSVRACNTVQYFYCSGSSWAGGVWGGGGHETA